MTNKSSLKAGSLLSLRNRIPVIGGFGHIQAQAPMWVCISGQWIIPEFFRTGTDAARYCEKLLEENITAVPKRVNITITFPQSQGDIS